MRRLIQAIIEETRKEFLWLQGVRSTDISAKVIRKIGTPEETVEEYGTIAHDHCNPIKWFINEIKMQWRERKREDQKKC